MLDEILLLAIGILMLIVAVPVGIFIYQRLVASAPKIPSVQEMQPKPQKETLKVPTVSAPAEPPRAPAPPPPPKEIVTSVETPAAGQVMDAPQATEMVQWNGMLLCTAGPLEGQRFIIEDDGFYIGRDSSLSQVVINDTRVSKRHVRIVPRNGKVMAVDQNSTNGTFLGKAGGQRITEVQLKRGDVLVLSDNAASFQYEI
jgi:pSer/pThr/pTyr-binding forkhead associated (FHA) protein